MKVKTILLDRDGTINVDKEYQCRPEQLEFIPGALQALKELHNHGYTLVIVTNQSGVGRGYYTEQDYHIFNQHLKQQLLKNGIIIQKTFYCPHVPEDNCNCRKPKIGILLNFIETIDKEKSYVIGDKTIDIKFAENLGIKSILVHTGKAGSDKTYDIKPTHVAKDLLQAAEKILKAKKRLQKE